MAAGGEGDFAFAAVVGIGGADDLAFGDEGVDLAGHGGGGDGEVFGDLLVSFGLGLDGDEDAEVVEGKAVLLAVSFEVEEAEEAGWGVGFHGALW